VDLPNFIARKSGREGVRSRGPVERMVRGGRHRLRTVRNANDGAASFSGPRLLGIDGLAGKLNDRTIQIFNSG
jgi:hypothetical protein